MKTAVSIPDPVFAAAERHAKRMQTSRSRLYAEALREYLLRHAPDEVAEAMDRVVDRLGEPAPDPFTRRAGAAALARTVW